MEPLGVALVAVLAFTVGTVAGLWFGGTETGARTQVRLHLRRPEPDHRGASRAASATLGVLDTLVADSVKRLASWITPQREEAGDGRLTLAPDGTLTLLFSDIADSTALNRQLGDDAFAELLRSHDAVVRDCVRHHEGQVVKTQGDGFMAAFHAPWHAVASALDLRQRLSDDDALGHPLEVRIGIHVGRAVTEAGDVFGENVAFAARVAQQARGGEVLVSQAVRDRVEPLAGEVEFVARVLPTRLKGLPGRHRLHRAQPAGS